MCRAEVRALHGDCVVDRSSLRAVLTRPDEEQIDTTGAEFAKVCEGGPPLEAVASLVKSTNGATICTELPDVSVTYGKFSYFQIAKFQIERFKP